MKGRALFTVCLLMLTLVGCGRTNSDAVTYWNLSRVSGTSVTLLTNAPVCPQFAPYAEVKESTTTVDIVVRTRSYNGDFECSGSVSLLVDLAAPLGERRLTGCVPHVQNCRLTRKLPPF